MKEGNNWVINVKVGDVKSKQDVTVTSVKKTDAATEATLDYKTNGRSLNTEVYRITASAVARLAGGLGGGNKMDPPIPIIKYPLTAGKSWTWEGSITVREQKVKASTKITVSGPEKVSTAAGDFSAMRVHSALVVEAQGQKISMPNDYCFAAGIGLVKQSAMIGSQKVDGDLESYKLK